MKTTRITILTVLLLLFLGCKDKVYNKYLANSPIYMSYDEFRNSIKFESPHAITTKGNIYVKGDYLFINEPYKGIHIIDNSVPTAPVNIGYLNVLGNTNIVIKDNYLFVNAFIDLVVLDISNITSPNEVSRVENVFPTSLPSLDYNPKYPIANIDKSKGIVVGFEIKEVKEETQDNPFVGCFECSTFTTDVYDLSAGNSSSTQSPNTGYSGSITKMTLINDYLYTIENNVLYSLNISDINNISVNEGKAISRIVETLFAGGDYLFMGTTTGLLIYDTSNPDNPNLLSVYNHTTGCDPVVVQGDYAYVTIRTGTSCQGTLNELDVVDISDVSNPTLSATFNMTNPHGLGIDGQTLFICDGNAGLKVFDATNPVNCGNQLIKQYNDIQATDVILFNQKAILIGDNGIYQYDYSDLNNINLLSTISF